MNSIQLRTLDDVPLGEYADCAGGRIFKSGSRPVSSPSSNTLGTNSHSRVTRSTLLSSKRFLLKNVRAFRGQVRKRFSRGIHQTVRQDCLSPHETARLLPSKLRPCQHSACGSLKRPR